MTIWKRNYLYLHAVGAEADQLVAPLISIREMEVSISVCSKSHFHYSAAYKRLIHDGDERKKFLENFSSKCIISRLYRSRLFSDV